MGEEAECPWEDKFARRFDQMVALRDDETGECWDSSPLVSSSPPRPSSCTGTVPINCNNNHLMPSRMRLFSALTPFRVPKEYSGLGSSVISDLHLQLKEYLSIIHLIIAE